MKKIYNILNSSVEVNASSDVLEFVDHNTYDLPILEKEPFKYQVTYIKDPDEYKRLCEKYKRNNIIRFYGEEYKDKYIDDNIVCLIDDDSIIMHEGNKYAIVGATDFSKNHVVYFIREAVYEGFLLKNHLLIHSAAFSDNNNASVLIGRPGAGKTTLLLEYLLNFNYDYVSNDLVGSINNNAIASIIPVRISNGTMSRFDHKEYDDLKAKRTINLRDFLEEFKLNIENNVPIKNIIFPKFDLNGTFKINDLDFNESMSIVQSQLMNLGDDVRPYLWVNEFDRKDINREELLDKLNYLMKNTNILEMEYGKSLSQENIKEMKRVIK